MHVRRWAGLALAGGTLATAAIVPATAAQAAATAQTLTIQVGGDDMVNGVPFEGMRFLAPPGMTVHKGDTITFEFRGFHTATLLPAGVNADEWRGAHQGLGGDYSVLLPDTDETSTFLLNNNVVFPSDTSGCGAPTNACAYDGSALVNSGLPLFSDSFTVTVNANPGDSFWVLCLLHGMMQTQINVVADSETTTTQDAINSYATSTAASDKEQAASLVPKLETPTKHKDAAGKTVWDAYAGFDGSGWGLDAMFPHKLKIARGDTVRWHFAQLTGNIHTVTFPKSAAVDYANSDFSGNRTVCENANGDTPPDAAPPQFCSTGPQDFEIELRGGAVLPQGGQNFYGAKSFRSSGVEGAEAGRTAPYDLTFKKQSPKHHAFLYACNVHGGMMTGKVVVR